VISRKRARVSLQSLLERGLITPDMALEHEGMIEEGVSYRTVMISLLGKITGELYVREEEAQHNVIHKIRISLDKLSVPEVMVLEDQIGLEPWHKERFSEMKTMERFRQEAAEPWHKCLLEKFRPDHKTGILIRSNPEIVALTPSILKMAYGVV
jgi:hypothetical protein